MFKLFTIGDEKTIVARTLAKITEHSRRLPSTPGDYRSYLFLTRPKRSYLLPVYIHVTNYKQHTSSQEADDRLACEEISRIL